MNIIPAIDLLDGQCVRLRQGQFDQVSIYADNPIDVLSRFEQAQCQRCHLVDLSGAKNPARRQLDLIKTLCQSALSLQVGGGIRSIAQVEQLLGLGVERVVIGSMAILDPTMVQQCLSHFGAEKIVLALDVTVVNGTPNVSIAGWQQQTTESLWDVLSRYPNLSQVLCTDIERDGIMKGPNVSLYQDARALYPQLNWIASGGVRHQQDLAQLAAIGIECTVIGKALYENTLTLEEIASW